MRFIDKNTRPVRLCDIEQRRQVPEIAIHGINSFHHHELAASLFARQRLIERCRVVMLEFVRATSRKRRAVAQTQMRAIIQDRYVVFAQQTGDGSERAAKSAVKKHGVFAPEKFCHLPLKLAVQVRHAGEHRRTACAETVRLQRFLRCGDDFGMICQPEIIVGTKVDHRTRPAVVIDGRARIGTGEQLRFVKFHREFGLSHPMRESGRRLERITRFVCQKITQTEFCRV